MKNDYKLEKKKDKPVIAICYDFDKTLSPTDMQAQGFIQKCKLEVDDFWNFSNGLAAENSMDLNSAWMYCMVKKSVGEFYVTRQKLEEYGRKVKLFKGVNKWFDRINKYAEKNGIIVEHYIISSGLKEMIDGTSIRKHFKEVYASSFYFNDKGVAEWPAQIVNYTNKTQFLFRIEKGVHNINDNRVNDYFNPKDIVIPFRNIIYIGDSDTDIPCMKLVNNNGGYSIGVYNPDINDKTKVYRMLNENRIGYFAKADYSEGEELDTLVKDIILKTASNEKLFRYHYNNLKEYDQYYENSNAEKKTKEKLIDALEESLSFASTHEIIKEMKRISDWTIDEAEELAYIALNNGQVKYIIHDSEIELFFNRLLKKYINSDNKEIRKLAVYLGYEQK